MYEVIKTGTKLKFNNVKDFIPEHVFDCGQCFRWKKESDTTWYGVVDGDFARVSFEALEEAAESTNQIGSTGDITIESYKTDEKFWSRYLDLDRNYNSIKKQLAKNDSVMADAIEEGKGIRILRQDVWETLVSFIISQNSNIPRIQGCIEALCREYGKEIGNYKGEKIYSFPELKSLTNVKENDLKICRLGYRAKYIAEAARQIDRDGGSFLEVAAEMDDRKVLKYLLGISGIGPKVASCIMLFSMGKLSIFPIDVWVKRVMNRLYGIAENDVAGMKEYADKHFGRFGGIAQQYLFYYIRRLSQSKPEVYKKLKIAESTGEIEL